MLHYFPNRLYQLTELSVVYKLKVIGKLCQHYFYFPTMQKDENTFLIHLFSICIFSSAIALSTFLDHCLHGEYFSLLHFFFEF